MSGRLGFCTTEYKSDNSQELSAWRGEKSDSGRKGQNRGLSRGVREASLQTLEERIQSLSSGDVMGDHATGCSLGDQGVHAQSFWPSAWACSKLLM